jgi:hypothetical protein
MKTHAAQAKAMALAGKNVGKSWLYRFKKRHPELKTVWASTIDSARAKQINLAVVQDFYHDGNEKVGPPLSLGYHIGKIKVS